MAPPVQRKAIDGERQSFTFRQTRRTVPMTFSMILVQASDRRSSGGNPSRVTVSISSSSWSIDAETRLQSFSSPRREIAQELFGLVRVVHLRGLPQDAPDLGMGRFGQSLHDVARLVDLTALNGNVAPEACPDRFGKGLRAVDDEEALHSRIEAAFDEIVDQRLNNEKLRVSNLNRYIHLLDIFEWHF